jgi:O-acetyl-ADP-ribose deacetylase (regulator of RNase III)
MNIIQGDLLELAEQGNFDIIVHGCNCFNTMRSGIARQIAERYPQAYAADCSTTKGDYNKLGNFSKSATNKFVIVNAYTQYHFNNKHHKEDLFEYISFAMILQKLVHTVGDCRFGFPMIGMGLAGGDKIKILSLLDDFDRSVQQNGGTVTLVEYSTKSKN